MAHPPYDAKDVLEHIKAMREYATLLCGDRDSQISSLARGIERGLAIYGLEKKLVEEGWIEDSKVRDEKISASCLVLRHLQKTAYDIFASDVYSRENRLVAVGEYADLLVKQMDVVACKAPKTFLKITHG